MCEDRGQIPIPWRKAVALILRDAKPGTVFIRQRARRDWASLTSCPFESVLREVLADALGTEGLEGKQHYMDEPGETYSFIFRYENFPVYAKIDLASRDQVVIVYSAHRPLKGEDL